MATAARSLRASPWSTVATLLVLAGAVGAHRSVAAAWSAILRPDLPYRDAEQLVQLEVRGSATPGSGVALLFGSEVETLTQEGRSFAWAGHSVPARMALPGRMLRVESMGPGAFDALGVPPAAGRLLRSEDHPGSGPGQGPGAPAVAAPVIVLSHQVAVATAGDPRAAVGTEVELDGRNVRVVGVMPEGFFFPYPQTEAWLPAPEARAARSSGSRVAAPTFARLRPGVIPAVAAAEATALLRASEWRPENQRVVATPVAEALTRPVRPTLDVLHAGALLLVLAAGASVAALRLSRAESERRGAAIRRCLGASAGDEWAVAGARVALLAGSVGGASWLLSHGLLPLMAPFAHGFSLAPRPGAGGGIPGVLAMPLVAAILAELPAALESHRDHGPGAGPTRWRGRGLLLFAGGAATSVVILIATAALGLGARSLLDGAESYPSAGLAEVTVDFEGRDFVLDHRERTRILEDLVRRFEARPDVVGAAWADGMPDDPSARFVTVTPRHGGRAAPFAADATLRLRTRSVSPGFLGLLEIPVLDGRGLLPADDPPAPPVVLADRPASLAASGSESALGELAHLGASQPRIVGMIPPIPVFPSGRAHPTIYQPHATPPLMAPDRSAVVAVRFRETPDAEALAALSGIVSGADPSLRALRVESVRGRRLRILGAPAAAAAVLGVFALCGILMAVAGAVGQVSDHAARASGELAIRKALGAPRDEIIWESVRRAAAAAGIATLVGGLGGWLLARFIASLVEWVGAADPFLYVGPAAFVALCLLLAGLITGWRASRAAPWPRLRTE